MDMNFRWMTQPYEDAARIEDDMEKRQVMQGMQRGPRGLAQVYAQNIAMQQAQQAAQQAQQQQKQREIFQQQMAQAQMQQQQQMAQQAQQAQQAADLKRLAELEAKRRGRMNDPNMRMAAMLAMAGQPGALMGLMTAPKQDTRSQSQAEMDTLEEKIANDMFALAGADKNTYAKLTAAILPLYKSKFDELSGKGAKSRMGANWDSGWGRIFRGQKGTRDKNEQDAAAKKEADKNAALLL